MSALDAADASTMREVVPLRLAARRALASAENCTNQSSIEVGALSDIPTVIPGRPWRLPLDGVFSGSPGLAFSAAPEMLGRWIDLNATSGVLHGMVPPGLGRVGKLVNITINAVSSCGRTASAFLAVPINAPPVAVSEIADMVVDTGSVQVAFSRVSLSTTFEDDDLDKLAYDLQAASAGANGTLGPAPSFAKLNSGPAPGSALPTLAAVESYNVSVDPLGAAAGTDVPLAITASDGAATAEARFTVHFVNHCRVSTFSNWTNCTALCDGGTQTRNRTVSAPPVGAKADACPALFESRACNTDLCAAAPRVGFTVRMEGINASTAAAAGLNQSLARVVALTGTINVEYVTVTLREAGTVPFAEGAASPGSQGRRLLGAAAGRFLAGVGATAPGAVAPVLVSVVEALVSILVPSSAGVRAQAVAEALDLASRSGALASSLAAAAAVAGVGPIVFKVQAVSLSQQGVVANAVPKARSRVVLLSSDGASNVVALQGTDADGDALDAIIINKPDAASGTLHQLSSVFSVHGYPPVEGDPVGAAAPGVAVLVTGSQSRVAFVPQSNAAEPSGAYGFVTHVVSDGKSFSAPALTWLLPQHGKVVDESFFVGTAGWGITSNGARQAALEGGGIAFEPYADGALDRYVIGIEASTNPDATGTDRTQWAFEAPATLSGNLAGGYGGALQFVLGAFEGSFDLAENLEVSTPLVELDCAACGGRGGVTLGHYVTASVIQRLATTPSVITVPLVPSEWRRKPATLNEAWQPIGECDLVAALSGLTGLRVRGDLTRDHEAVGLDAVSILSAQAMLRLSAAGTGAAISARVAAQGLPVDCGFALTGNVTSGGVSAVALALA